MARRRPEDTAEWVNLHRHLPLQRRVADDGGGGDSASSQPLVSVLIVHHERPRLLTQAVHSVIAQEYRRVEIVVRYTNPNPTLALAITVANPRPHPSPSSSHNRS